MKQVTTYVIKQAGKTAVVTEDRYPKGSALMVIICMSDQNNVIK